MEFKNEMQKNVHAMLGSWLAEPIKAGSVFAETDRPAFMVQQGSAIVRVSVGAIGDDEAAITVGSSVVSGAKITGELMAFLLAHNFRSMFGAFGINPETGTITFDHSIIGSTCDQKELLTSIAAVASTADQFDDPIIEKFGGKTALQIATGK